MKATANTLTMAMLTADENPYQRAIVYRLRKRFAVVQFGEVAKGRIVFLPEGAELRVVGSSQLSGCAEVLCKRQTYNMFEIDLCGPWCHRTELSSIKSSRLEPERTAVAVGACA